MRLFFVKRPKFLPATSSLRVEQNVVHLGRFRDFSQKVVGVTLNPFRDFSSYHMVASLSRLLQTQGSSRISFRILLTLVS